MLQLLCSVLVALYAATEFNSLGSHKLLGLPVVVSGLRFYHGFFCFFVSYPPSSLNGTQPKPATCSEVSAI